MCIRDRPETHWVGPSLGTYEYVLRVKWLPNSEEVAIITMNRPQTDATLTLSLIHISEPTRPY